MCANQLKVCQGFNCRIASFAQIVLIGSLLSGIFSFQVRWKCDLETRCWRLSLGKALHPEKPFWRRVLCALIGRNDNRGVSYAP